jgi:hypothetical protein
MARHLLLPCQQVTLVAEMTPTMTAEKLVKPLRKKQMTRVYENFLPLKRAWKEKAKKDYAAITKQAATKQKAGRKKLSVSCGRQQKREGGGTPRSRCAQSGEEEGSRAGEEDTGRGRGEEEEQGSIDRWAAEGDREEEGE